MTKNSLITSGNTNHQLNPLRILSAISIIAGTWSMLFEIYFFQGFQIELYLARVSFTFLSAIVFALTFRNFSRKIVNMLTHVLILGLISSFIFTIIMIPSTIYINSQILSLLIFTFAIIFSWEVTQQIIVAIYYNLLFAASIFYSDKNIFQLPNVLSLVLFVSFISLLSVAASAVIYKNRKKYIEKTNEIKFLFDNASVGILKINKDGKIIAANNYLLNLFEITDFEVEHNIFDILAPGEKERELIRNKILAGKYDHLEERIVGKSGEVKHLHIISKEIETDTNLKAIECIITDKTKEKQAEREKNLALEKLFEEAREKELIAQKVIDEKNQKIKLLAKINHEVRTPLNAILLYFDMIENKQLTTIEEFEEFAKTVKVSAESLLQVISNFIDFAKIEAGKIEIENEEFDLLKEVRSVTKLLSYLSEEKGNKLTLITKDMDNSSIVTDKIKYRQILINLIGNSIKFTKNGEIQISLETKQTEKRNGILTTKIQDTGRGIPPDLMEKIFEPFKTSADSSGREASSGLGLAICSEYVNLLGGKIVANSEFGIGTTVTFSINYKIAF
ncbi:MAG: ATP-binding protein [Melioribacteraceae bacterium]|jgi:PAS domain S-box-containing protein|nr:ATP-binding protein [Melioribacteraceae bacterium]RJP61955.1 MAG: PAS domain S-box protein [Ignavibacteriales bacterium]WKZ70225.1 MAG: ATP-binding protein [Melioribacteraceae bacterium]